MADLPLSLPAVPEGFCNSLNDANWIQTLLNLIAKGVAKFEGSGFSVIMDQSTAPGPNDRANLWRDSDTGIIYKWNGGAWISPNPEGPSSKARKFWVGTTVELETYDGGSSGVVSTNSGPMWEVDTDWTDKVPIGAGTIAAVNVDAGAEDVSIANENLPLTRLKMFQSGLLGPGSTSLTATDNCRVGVNVGASEDYVIVPGATPSEEPDLGLTSSFGQATPDVLTTTSAVRGIYLIKRTSRSNYVGA